MHTKKVGTNVERRGTHFAYVYYRKVWDIVKEVKYNRIVFMYLEAYNSL